MAKRSCGITLVMKSARAGSRRSRSRVSEVVAETSSRKSSSSARSLKRTEDFRMEVGVAMRAGELVSGRGSGSSGGFDDFHAGAGADPGGTGGGHFLDVVEGANSPRSFHANAGT